MGPSLILLPKRARSHTKQSGFNRAWLKSFPWVLDVEGEGMLCRLCRKHARRPQKAVVGKTIYMGGCSLCYNDTEKLDTA